MHAVHDKLKTVRHRNNLDFIRSFLAIGVCVQHSLYAFNIKVSFLFVPAFTAISGYLITRSMEQSRGYGHFLWKRVLRVGPAFLVALAIVALLDGDLKNTMISWLTMGLRSNELSWD